MSCSQASDEVVQERVALVAVHTVLRVDQAQRGRGDHRLLDRHARVTLCRRQVAVRVTAEPEGSRRELRELSRVTICERDHGAVGCQVLQPFERIGREARLRLFSVGDHGRARSLEPLDRVAQRSVLEFVEPFGRELASTEGRHAVDEFLGSGDAADGFGGDQRVLLGFGSTLVRAADHTFSVRCRSARDGAKRMANVIASYGGASQGCS